MFRKEKIDPWTILIYLRDNNTSEGLTFSQLKKDLNLNDEEKDFLKREAQVVSEFFYTSGGPYPDGILSDDAHVFITYKGLISLIEKEQLDTAKKDSRNAFYLALISIFLNTIAIGLSIWQSHNSVNINRDQLNEITDPLYGINSSLDTTSALDKYDEWKKTH